MNLPFVPTLCDNNFHYLFGVYDGTTNSVYVDNVKSGSATQSLNTNSNGYVAIGWNNQILGGSMGSYEFTASATVASVQIWT